jgi:formylglycine-generating enzyme required for sulfatase activity
MRAPIWLILTTIGLGCRQLLDIEDLAPDDTATSRPPSCRGLLAECGPAGNDDCCHTLVVPGGNFLRSNDPSFPASVSAFRLDRYEVDVGRLRRFVEAGGGTQSAPPRPGDGAHPRHPGSGWRGEWTPYLPADRASLLRALGCSNETRTWSDVAGPRENRPANCLSWFVGFAFCAYDGGRLPTEAEWNFAAAGGPQQRAYPWGDSLPEARRASFACGADGAPGCAIDDLVAVGSLPEGDGPFGHADLAGNVFEWTRDADGPYTRPCVDCANLIDGPGLGHSMRGGDYSGPATQLESGYRGHSGALDTARNVGVRCARDP